MVSPIQPHAARRRPGGGRAGGPRAEPAKCDRSPRWSPLRNDVNIDVALHGRVTSAESLGRIPQRAWLLAGLSQRELARRLGTTQKYVWELETGKPSIVMDRLFAVMRETGMKLTATITPRD